MDDVAVHREAGRLSGGSGRRRRVVLVVDVAAADPVERRRIEAVVGRAERREGRAGERVQAAIARPGGHVVAPVDESGQRIDGGEAAGVADSGPLPTSTCVKNGQTAARGWPWRRGIEWAAAKGDGARDALSSSSGFRRLPLRR